MIAIFKILVFLRPKSTELQLTSGRMAEGLEFRSQDLGETLTMVVLTS